MSFNFRVYYPLESGSRRHPMKIISTTLLLLLLTGSSLLGQSTERQVFRFLNLPVNARAASLGGNHPVLLDGEASHFQINPSYLASDSHNQIALSYINYLSDINFAFANWAYEWKGIGTFGAGVRYVGYGEFNRTDELGQTLGSFQSGEFALTLGYARSYSKQFHYGLSLDLIHGNLDRFNSTAIALSAGARYEFTDGRTVIGAALRNVGRQLTTFDGTEEDLPVDLLVGISHRVEKAPIRLTLSLHRLTDWELENREGTGNLIDQAFRHLLFGSEFLFSEHVHLRLGYNHLLQNQLAGSGRIETAGMSIGLGINVKNITFDVSRNSYSSLGGFTQLSIRTRI